MPRRTNKPPPGFDGSDRVVLRAFLEAFQCRAECTRELRRASESYRLELSRVAELEEQVAGALRSLLGPAPLAPLASLPVEEREAVLDLWSRFSNAMRDAARAQEGRA